jgi:hypothetical protein
MMIIAMLRGRFRSFVDFRYEREKREKREKREGQESIQGTGIT